jgi:hypothetical protein
MDFCCEPQVTEDRPLRLLRMAATVQLSANVKPKRRAAAYLLRCLFCKAYG